MVVRHGSDALAILEDNVLQSGFFNILCDKPELHLGAALHDEGYRYKLEDLRAVGDGCDVFLKSSVGEHGKKEPRAAGGAHYVYRLQVITFQAHLRAS